MNDFIHSHPPLGYFLSFRLPLIVFSIALTEINAVTNNPKNIIFPIIDPLFVLLFKVYQRIYKESSVYLFSFIYSFIHNLNNSARLEAFSLTALLNSSMSSLGALTIKEPSFTLLSDISTL